MWSVANRFATPLSLSKSFRGASIWQVWIGSIRAGPARVRMNGRFDTSAAPEYQDDVGSIVLQVCQVTKGQVEILLSPTNLPDML